MSERTPHGYTDANFVITREPLRTRWPVHSQDEIDAVADILRGGVAGCEPSSGLTNYWTGREGQAFETEWSHMVGLPHALTVSNGTTALECAIRALGTGPAAGEVVVPCRTFMATASAVVTAGGKPVLADIDAASLCVTPETIEARLTERTVGVIVVHWAGLPVPRMDEIIALCMRRGLWLVEDCAHAHGAPVGRQSHVACWSFCVGKIISTGGEGGMVACLDDGLAAKMRAFRDHGRFMMVGGPDPTAFEYKIESYGSNLRMTEMQSVLGRFQLRGLAAQIARRREIAAAYDVVLGERALYTRAQRETHARYLYHVTVEDKVGVMKALIALGIPARFGGCGNLGREPVFGGDAAPCPVGDWSSEHVLALPVYPTMSEADTDRVCGALNEVLG